MFFLKNTKRRLKNNILISILLLFAFSSRTLFAEPQPSRLVVHHEKEECAFIFGGDECGDTVPTDEGWIDIGYVSEASCPKGYRKVETEFAWQPYKNERCCTKGHSGVHGDCDDLIINNKEKKCAFVEEITDCILPEGWVKRPENVRSEEWECPYYDGWIKNIKCRERSVRHGIFAGCSLRN